MSEELKQAAPILRGIVDPDDGENRAVRAFLAYYGCADDRSTLAMKTHLKRSGYPYWPAWADEPYAQGHLTKSGAQNWIRYLFSLET